MNELSNISLADMPSFTEHDTRVEKKAHYGQIVARFQEADCSDTQNLVYLIDTIDQMSPEIYEHYRSLQDLFRVNIQGLLNAIRQPGDRYQARSEEELQQLAYCLQKACANHTLLQEKYQDLHIIR
ncbi:MAG: hypothetical protein Q4E86_05670 [Lachnospiraceae bacterium]|nr:hypothetical protein [Lachnospiraceae bacterium]MDO5551442.1 hypothetical protein [Lachnospiraceae bacterium]